MRINPFIMPALTVTLMFGTVFGAQAFGLWSTSGRDSTALDALTPAAVKGWMTLQQVSDGIPIPLNELYPLMNIPADIPPATALKDLEAVVPGFEVSTLRTRLSAWLVGATPAEATAVLPAEVPAMATARPPESSPTARTTPTPEALSPTATHLPEPLGGGAQGSGDGQGQIAACTIRGRMTLAEVSADCAIAPDVLLAALHLPAGTALETAIKDLANQGLVADVQTIQIAVATLQAVP
ncbi:MAG: hypothetical protein JNL73_14425 [Anaerolineales bacterium]|nr:hypothetical protein [Anaerolineales bacterium]